MQYVVGIQHEIWKDTVAEVSYVATRGSDLFRMMNVNTTDLVANGFIRGFAAARRNLLANGNPNVGESTGNFGKLMAARSRRA